jgi:lysophospholipase L1-like esterase
MTVNLSEAWRGALGCAAVAALTLLAVACGGSTETTTHFHASRIVAFGDESSLLVDSGDHNARKFSVNATVFDTDQTIVCALNPLWIQGVGNIYGLVFPECNNGTPPVFAPVSRIRAAFGARAADLGAQIDAQQAESPLGAGDLVTVMIGANDVLALYAQYPAQSEDQLVATAEAAGTETGRQVNRLTDLGAKVLLSTIFNMGVTPFAASERAAHADTDRAALLTHISSRYNALLRATIVNDGRKIGLVLMDEFVTDVSTIPGAGGFTNFTDPVCDLTKSQLTPPSSLDCTAQTFVSGGSAVFLWADNLHLSATGQSSLASLAISRAQNNPF